MMHDDEPTIEHDNAAGQRVCIWKDASGKVGRDPERGPAVVVYARDGQVVSAKYMVGGREVAAPGMDMKEAMAATAETVKSCANRLASFFSKGAQVFMGGEDKPLAERKITKAMIAAGIVAAGMSMGASDGLAADGVMKVAPWADTPQVAKTIQNVQGSILGKTPIAFVDSTGGTLHANVASDSCVMVSANPSATHRDYLAAMTGDPNTLTPVSGEQLAKFEAYSQIMECKLKAEGKSDSYDVSAKSAVFAAVMLAQEYKDPKIIRDIADLKAIETAHHIATGNDKAAVESYIASSMDQASAATAEIMDGFFSRNVFLDAKPADIAKAVSDIYDEGYKDMVKPGRPDDTVLNRVAFSAKAFRGDGISEALSNEHLPDEVLKRMADATRRVAFDQDAVMTAAKDVGTSMKMN